MKEEKQQQVGRRMGNLLVNSNHDKFLNEDELLERRARRARPIVIPSSKFKTFEPTEKIEGQSWKALTIMSKGLLMDVKIINQMYSLFRIADLDNSGSIDVLEFLYFLRIEDSPFNQRFFSLFDMDNSGEIDFLEFVCSLWNLCTWEEKNLSELLFYVYDADRSGELELAECEQLITDIFAKRQVRTEESLLKESLRAIAVDGTYAHERHVHLEDFVRWAEFHNEVVHPIKCMYILVRRRILGEEYWDEIGKRARREAMAALTDLVRHLAGKPGDEEAVLEALMRNEKERERELQKRQQEAAWESSNDDVNNASSGLKRNYEEAKHRVRAVQYLHEERMKKYKSWYDTMKSIENKDDPLSILLRFNNRTLTKQLRNEFEASWKRAMPDLQKRLYDRPARLSKLLQNKQGKEDLYFRRKLLNSLDEEDTSEAFVQYSTAAGKLTWVEQMRMQKKNHVRALKAAGGNRHLGKTQRQKEGEQEDSSADESDGSEEEFSSDEEFETRLVKARNASPDLKQLHRKYYENWKVDHVSSQTRLQDALEQEEAMRKKKTRQRIHDEEEGQQLDKESKEMESNNKAEVDLDNEQMQENDDEEEKEQKEKRCVLNGSSYKHMPQSSKTVVHLGQYPNQNLKRPPEAWKKKQIVRLQNDLAGRRNVSESGKPYRAPRERKGPRSRRIPVG